MKREITGKLAKAAYEERLNELTKGVRPKSAFTIPNPLQHLPWDEAGDGVQSLYHKEAEAVMGAFWTFIVLHGTAEMQAGMATIWLEMKKMGIFTDVELAQMEGGERQDE